MPEVKLQPLEESEYAEWDSFVARARSGTVFHTAWWYDAWGVRFRIYARRNGDGEIEAGMPVYISGDSRMPKVFGVKGLTRPPLTLVNGPLFLDSAKAGRCGRYTHAKREAMGAISSLPEAGFYDILLHRFQEDLMPYIWNGFDTQVYYTYVIPKEEAPAWRDNMFTESRRVLKVANREAEADGFSIEADPPMEETLPLYLGAARSKRFSMAGYAGKIPSWWKAVREKGAGRSYLLRDKGGRALCANTVVWDGNAAYGTLVAKAEEAPQGINMLLYERAITDALERGLDFDFAGSVLRGVEAFIRRWGGELRPCYRAFKVPSIFTYTGLKAYRYMKFHRKRGWVE